MGECASQFAGPDQLCPWACPEPEGDVPSLAAILAGMANSTDEGAGDEETAAPDSEAGADDLAMTMQSLRQPHRPQACKLQQRPVQRVKRVRRKQTMRKLRSRCSQPCGSQL